MPCKTVWLKILLIPAVLIYLTAFIYSCSDDNEYITPSATPYRFPEIKGFPLQKNIPEENPITVEGVELGRYLFYDGRLSGRTHPDSLMSCATCHIQEKAFECGIDHPRFKDGITRGIPSEEYPEGKATPHVMLPTVNLVYNQFGYLWNGWINEFNNHYGSETYDVEPLPAYHFNNIESLVWMSIVAPHEMNGSIEQTVKTISEVPMYPQMFQKAFGTEEITYKRISKAIGQFVRTIISYRSKFHRYMRAETGLNDAELRGMELFFSEDGDCFHCHAGSMLMTTNQFYNNAKDSVFDDPRDRYSVTGDPNDIGAYKAPSLINCELTAPYMHDGRFESLEDVIDFYSDGLVNSPYAHPLMKQSHEGGVHLTTQEKEDLKAFLLTLTDHELLKDPQYSRPKELIEMK
ncbi:MAG TPA: cytochrome-c peroxidase [Cyclobacteriaceae bacterium]